MPVPRPAAGAAVTSQVPNESDRARRPPGEPSPFPTWAPGSGWIGSRCSGSRYSCPRRRPTRSEGTGRHGRPAGRCGNGRRRRRHRPRAAAATRGTRLAVGARLSLLLATMAPAATLHAGGAGARRPDIRRARGRRRPHGRARPGERHLQRAAAAHVRGDDGGRSRRHRPAPARTGRDVHGHLPRDVGGRSRGIVVVSADGARHRHTGIRPPAGRRQPPLWPFVVVAAAFVAAGAIWAARRRP